jgi:hypothetical protein
MFIIDGGDKELNSKMSLTFVSSIYDNPTLVFRQIW